MDDIASERGPTGSGMPAASKRASSSLIRSTSIERGHTTRAALAPQVRSEGARLGFDDDQVDGMARDLAAARRLFGQRGATGWDDYARSIEA